MSIKGYGLAEYLGSGDPALKDYYPAWLDNMADRAAGMRDGQLVRGVIA